MVLTERGKGYGTRYLKAMPTGTKGSNELQLWRVPHECSLFGWFVTTLGANQTTPRYSSGGSEQVTRSALVNTIFIFGNGSGESIFEGITWSIFILNTTCAPGH